jgi:hypothetical protein
MKLLLLVLAFASGVSARNLFAANKTEFVFSNELLTDLARNPPKTSVPLPAPTPGGRAGARVVPVSFSFVCVRAIALVLTRRFSARIRRHARSHWCLFVYTKRSRRFNWRHVRLLGSLGPAFFLSHRGGGR